MVNFDIGIVHRRGSSKGLVVKLLGILYELCVNYQSKVGGGGTCLGATPNSGNHTRLTQYLGQACTRARPAKKCAPTHIPTRTCQNSTLRACLLTPAVANSCKLDRRALVGRSNHHPTPRKHAPAFQSSPTNNPRIAVWVYAPNLDVIIQ